MQDFSLDLCLAADSVGQKGAAAFSFCLDDGACADLAARFRFLSVDNMQGVIKISRIAADCWQLDAEITAHIVQECGITGDAVPEALSYTVCERYVDGLEDVQEVDPMGADTEVLEGGFIPVGEAIAQSLALNAAAWPRHPDAPQPVPDEGHARTIRPFAKLSELKK